MLRKLLVRSPAAIRSTNDIAAWKMMRDFCGIDERSRVDRLMPRKASAGSECEVIQAGTVPKITPVNSESRNAKPRTGNDGVGFTGNWVASGNASVRMVRVPA